MDIYEGYSYRINIVGADSAIIVDSHTGLIKASVADAEENIIVDVDTGTLRGTLVGDVFSQNLELILDSKTRNLNVKSVVADTVRGSIYNNRDTLMFDCFHDLIKVSTIETKEIVAESILANQFKGNICKSQGSVMYNSITDTISTNTIYTTTITAENVNAGNLYAAAFTGSIVDKDEKLLFESNQRKFHGAIHIDQLTVGSEIGAATVELYAGSGGINVYNHYSNNSVDDDFNCMTFRNARLTDNNLDNIVPGDVLSYFSTQGYYKNQYQDTGAFYFIADPAQNKYDNAVDSIPAIFGVYVCNGEQQPDNKEEILSKSFTYNSSGVLSSSIIKTGAHTDNIVNPEKGMIVFNDTVGKFQGYTGISWVDLH